MSVRQTAVFAALADPTRRAIFERLCRKGEHTVWMLTERADVSQQAVSKHLDVLGRAGLVRCEREGRETRYSARTEGLAPLSDWVEVFVPDLADKFEALVAGFDKKDRGRK